MAAGSQASERAARLASLEDRLSGILKPVPPRKEFVRGLSNRIQSGERASFVNHVANWHFVVMVIASLFSLIVLIVVGIRMLLALGEKKRPQMG